MPIHRTASVMTSAPGSIMQVVEQATPIVVRLIILPPMTLYLGWLTDAEELIQRLQPVHLRRYQLVYEAGHGRSLNLGKKQSREKSLDCSRCSGFAFSFKVNIVCYQLRSYKTKSLYQIVLNLPTCSSCHPDQYRSHSQNRHLHR